VPGAYQNKDEDDKAPGPGILQRCDGCRDNVYKINTRDGQKEENKDLTSSLRLSSSMTLGPTSSSLSPIRSQGLWIKKARDERYQVFIHFFTAIKDSLVDGCCSTDVIISRWPGIITVIFFVVTAGPKISER